MKNQTKSNRGGKRPNAGRKKDPKSERWERVTIKESLKKNLEEDKKDVSFQTFISFLHNFWKENKK
jgi:hypothetical protein